MCLRLYCPEWRYIYPKFSVIFVVVEPVICTVAQVIRLKHFVEPQHNLFAAVGETMGLTSP